MSNIQALVTELKVQQIITEQVRVGVNLDLSLCHNNIRKLENLKSILYSEVRPVLKAEVVKLEGKVPKDMIWPERNYIIKKGEYNFVKKIYNANGDKVSKIVEYCENSSLCFDTIGGSFSRVIFEEPQLSKRQKLCQQLIRLGWKPEHYTKKGSPQLTYLGQPVESLSKISGKIGKRLSRWFIASHRQSQIQGWIDRVRDNGRIEARCNPGSTNTARSKHSVVCNVPKARDSVFFGKEMRGVFIASKGYELCGWDASGLEARVAAHYTHPVDQGEFAKELLEGDVHSKTAEYFSIDRGTAKTIFYGLTT